MNYNGRLSQFEKKSNQERSAKKDVRIKIDHPTGKEFEKSYALFQARKKLGLVKFDDPKKKFVSADKDIEDKYENLTTNQAEKIIKEIGDGV